MKVSIDDSFENVTEVKIRHRGAKLGFNWICENPVGGFVAGTSCPNRLEICIDDVLELENLIYMLERAKKEMRGMIGHFE